MKHSESITFATVRLVNFGKDVLRLELFLPSLPLSHQRDVDTVSGGDGSKRNKTSNQGRDVLEQERGDIKQEGGA